MLILLHIIRNMYAPEVEDLFLNYATHILFEPTKKTFEYDKPIFDESLPNAKFDQEYEKIDTSWQRSTAMTPLFVSTQDADGRVSIERFSRIHETDERQIRVIYTEFLFQEIFSKSFIDGGGLRATQTSLAFSLTQTEGKPAKFWMVNMSMILLFTF